MSESQWSRADRAGAALQAYVDERKGIGSSYGDEGSDEFFENVTALLVDLKHLLFRADPTAELARLAEEAVDIWAAECETLPELPEGEDQDA